MPQLTCVVVVVCFVVFFYLWLGNYFMANGFNIHLELRLRGLDYVVSYLKGKNGDRRLRYFVQVRLFVVCYQLSSIEMLLSQGGSRRKQTLYFRLL